MPFKKWYIAMMFMSAQRKDFRQQKYNVKLNTSVTNLYGLWYISYGQ